MTENAVRIALTRMRRDFRDHLLIEVKQTLDEGEDARAEIRYLLGFFEPSQRFPNPSSAAGQSRTVPPPVPRRPVIPTPAQRS